MAEMTLQLVSKAGVSPAFAAANIQDTIESGGSDRVFMHVKNGGGAPVNVTIAAIKTSVPVQGVGDLTVPDIVVAVAAGDEDLLGPFEAAYSDGNGTITVDYSDVTTVTSAAFKLGKLV